MTGPLAGIRILDLSVALTGPLAVGMLADQGAEVIKIERPPFGDQARYIGTGVAGISSMFQVANRGKRSAVVDLADPALRDRVLALAAGADVFVHNYRPGVAERLGLGEAAVRTVCPDIVYVAISGFGPDGPYAHRRVYDTVVQAQSGLAANQTGRDDPSPAFLRQLAADKITAYTAAQAITAALFARERGAGGQRVDLAMLDAAIAFLFVDGAGHQVVLDGDHTGPTSATADTKALALADGFVVVTPVGDHEFHGLAAAFGVDSSDPRLATIGDRFAHRELMADVMRQVHAAAASVTVTDAVGRLEAADVPYGVVLPVGAVPDDAQVRHNESFLTHEHPAMGTVRQPRPPARFSATPAQLAEPSAPTLGQHTDDVLTKGWHPRA